MENLHPSYRPSHCPFQSPGSLLVQVDREVSHLNTPLMTAPHLPPLNTPHTAHQELTLPHSQAQDHLGPDLSRTLLLEALL